MQFNNKYDNDMIVRYMYLLHVVEEPAAYYQIKNMVNGERNVVRRGKQFKRKCYSYFCYASRKKDHKFENWKRKSVKEETAKVQQWEKATLFSTSFHVVCGKKNHTHSLHGGLTKTVFLLDSRTEITLLATQNR